MFTRCRDRIEELKLLRLCLSMARSNKELIVATEALEPIIKKNGEVHKTIEGRRKTFIKSLLTENKKLKQWFEAHNKPEPESYDNKRYSYSETISRNRRHLT